MEKTAEAYTGRRKAAIEKLRNAERSLEPQDIREAALACFEVGAPRAAQRLLKRLEKRMDFAQQPWSQRYLSWIDAAAAKRRLADMSPIHPGEFEKIAALASRLRNASRFDLSRRLLARLLGEPEDLLASPPATAERQSTENVLSLVHGQRNMFMQKLALSTYKDANLHPSRTLAEAERLLWDIGLDDPACVDPETLGLGGAVFKRRWELTGRREYLERSLKYYRRGWHAKDANNNRYDKDAYCGINAAFVWDLLASRRGELRREHSPWRYSSRLRRAIIDELSGRDRQDPWAMTSLADAYFGIGDYENARVFYEIASGLMAGDWERKTTFLQAVELARLQGIPLPGISESEKEWHPAWRSLWPLLGERTAAALVGARPKTGLALSGGGFRAAFYHLGVLARLAEADMLRHIEVISTVSGGSIVGTLYFLKLKKLLESKRDEDIVATDYCRLVHELIDELRAGVEKNLRMSAFASIKAIARMAFELDYNRTIRIGELYDEHFYRKALGIKKQTVLRDLIVVPKEAFRDFSPRLDNGQRRAKVPILLINATTLNSGHSWQFAGSFMGEPAGLLEAEIDANERYARIHFDERKCAAMQDFPLGTAVAASSAVPGLFNPVRLSHLYKDRDVQLSDGGVYDNQGIDTLLQENCKIILCSDGSGQLDDDHSPSTLLPGILRRANDIAMERVRIVGYQDLRSRKESGSLKELLFVHLRQGLDIRHLQPRCADARKQNDKGAPKQTDFGVDKEIQRRLSRMRTDLDSFSEVESDALMMSGYLATGKQIEDGEIAIEAEQGCGDWQFQRIRNYLATPSDPGDPTLTARIADIKRQLEVSSRRFAKPLYLERNPINLATLVASAITALAVIIIGGIAYWKAGLSILAIPGGVATLAVLSFITLMVKAEKRQWLPPIRRLGELVLATLFWPIAQFGLRPGNGLFLSRGSINQVTSIK